MRDFAFASKLHRSVHPAVEDPKWIHELWPCMKASDINQEHYSEFLRFAEAQVEIFNSICPVPSPFQNLSDVLQLVTLFQREVNLTRQRATEIAMTMLSQGEPDASLRYADLVWRSVELATRLWANLNIRVPANTSGSPTSGATPAVFPGKQSYFWLDDGPLQAFILRHFENRARGRIQASPSSLALKIEPKCTMAYLSQAYDFHPYWTSNLADHLNIDTDSRTITIYEHKIFLWNHLKSSRSRGPGNSPPILPPSVLTEAIDTLNLLFPFGDDATEAFLRREGKGGSFYGLGSCTRGRTLDVSRYEFSRREVEDIASIISQPPRGRAQFLLDREGTNSREVWAFWIAIAFGALAAIGVASGVYSAIYARKAFDVGMLQYRLTLALACVAENATEELLDFCR